MNDSSIILASSQFQMQQHVICSLIHINTDWNDDDDDDDVRKKELIQSFFNDISGEFPAVRESCSVIMEELRHNFCTGFSFSFNY